MFARLALIFLMSASCAAAQNEIGTVANKYFRRGNEAIEEGRFADADSLYTLSLSYGQFFGTYFNRALARKKLNDREGFCRDMAEAANYGDTIAQKIVLDSCGVKMELCFDSAKQPLLEGGCVYKMHVEGSGYLNQFFYTLTDASKDTLEISPFIRSTIRYGLQRAITGSPAFPKVTKRLSNS